MPRSSNSSGKLSIRPRSNKFDVLLDVLSIVLSESPLLPKIFKCTSASVPPWKTSPVFILTLYIVVSKCCAAEPRLNSRTIKPSSSSVASHLKNSFY